MNRKKPLECLKFSLKNSHLFDISQFPGMILSRPRSRRSFLQDKTVQKPIQEGGGVQKSKILRYVSFLAAKEPQIQKTSH